MEHNQQNGFNRFIKGVKDYWLIIAFIATLIFTWGQVLLKINYQGKNIEEIKTQQATTAEDVGDIKISIAEIKGFIGKWDGVDKKK